MDKEECYAWAEIFICEWDSLVAGMSERAGAMGLAQEERDGVLVWKKDSSEQCRWAFVEDPSDIESVRAIYNDNENVKSPSCFIVVKQPDPSDDRGDIIFDIFRTSPQSYLWHFNRVYTRPKS
jgi:hypothetical protein